MSALEVKVPDIGDFKDIPVIEVFVKAGDTALPRIRSSRSSRTSDDGRPVAGALASSKEGEGETGRQGERRLAHRRAGNCRLRTPRNPQQRPQRRRGVSACTGTRSVRRTGPTRRASAPRSRRPLPTPGGRDVHRQGRHRMPEARAGRRAGWLQRGVPRGRPRHEDRAGRTLTALLGGVCLNVGCIPSKALCTSRA
jgi:hypothetical protein